MNSKVLYKRIEPYKCPKCNQDSLFFSSLKGDINYKEIFKNGNTLTDVVNYLYKFHIKFLRCKNCNNTYIIDWTKKWPLPLTDKEKIQAFGV